MAEKINKYIFNSAYWLTAFFAFLFFIMVCLNVFTRYVLKSPILASIELSRIFFVWACFFAAGITFHRRGHIAISFITDLMPVVLQRWIGLIIESLTLVFIAGILIWSAEVVIRIWHSEFPILGISQSWLYVPLTIVSSFMLFSSLEKIFVLVRTFRKKV